MGLHPADLATLVAFLLGITALGFFSKRAVHDREDFFLGGRRFGKAMMAFHAFGTGTHTDQAVGVVSKSYEIGMPGIWVQWNWMFATPIYWLLAPWLRRTRCLTLADLYEERYSRSAAVMAVVVASFCSILSMGIMLLGTARTVQGMLGYPAETATLFGDLTVPSGVPFYVILLGITGLFVLYGAAAGIVGAVRTDFVQGMFIIVLSGLALPGALQLVGGLTGIRSGVPEPHFLDLISPDPAQMNLWFIAALLVLAPVSIVGQSHIMSVTSAGRNELDGRFGMCYGNFLKRFCTVAWCLLGVAWLVHDLSPGREVLSDPDLAFGTAVAELLPVGLTGLMMACVVAAAMSTSDSVMVAVAGLWTQNVYRPFVKPDADERHYVNVGRLVSVIVVVGSLLFAIFIGGVVTGLFKFWKISGALGISVWLALLWRRTNSYGAWASCLVALLVYALTEFILKWPSDLQAVQIALLLGLGALAGVIVSLLTAAPKQEILDRFYTKLHTPIGQEEKLELPLDEAVPKERRVIDCLGLLVAKPNLESWGGFLIAWGLVAFLIGGTWLLVSP